MSTARLSLTAILLAAAACTADGTTDPQPAVASISVTLTQAAAQAGAEVGATAVLRDADGQVIVRPVEWSSSNPLVATVSEAGAVSTVGAGSTTISAASEGRSGSASLVVTSSVAQVAISGPTRLKVGDDYQLTAELRGADGAIIDRPVVWSVRDRTMSNSPYLARITETGVLTPLLTGTTIVQATIENIAYERVLSSYDWEGGAEGQVSYMRLESDAPVTDPFGRLFYPEIGVTCSGSTAELVVHTGSAIAPNGSVSIVVDGGAPLTGLWLVRSDANWDGIDGLEYPGGNLVAAIAAARHVAFSFTDVHGVVRTAEFRVTGLEVALTMSMLGVSNPLCF